MKTYARIDGGFVMEMIQTDDDITKMFEPSLVWIDVTPQNPQPAIGWAATEQGGTWTFGAPPAPSASALWSAYQELAMAALEDSDTTILRCYENAVAVPAAWATYRKTLRAIVSALAGDSTQPLPTKPAYPAGT